MRYRALAVSLLSYLVMTGDTRSAIRAESAGERTERAGSRLAAAPRFSTARLATGVRLRYAEQGDPTGEPIILLHGYTDSWFSYSRVLPLLNPKYRVYVPDQRGHGDSERPARGYQVRDFAADVLAFMDAKKVRRATIVGHSMGGFIAQHVAAAAPKRVMRLVIAASAATSRNNTVLEFHRAVDALTDPIPEKFARDFQVGTVFHPVPPEFMDRVIRESRKVPARVWRAVLSGLIAPDAGARLDRIQSPTLVLWGDRDSLFSRSEQDRLVSGIPGAILKVYPETGHGMHWERPEDFVRDLESFIERGLRSSP